LGVGVATGMTAGEQRPLLTTMMGSKTFISLIFSAMLTWAGAGKAGGGPPPGGEPVNQVGTAAVEMGKAGGSPALRLAALPGGPDGVVRLRVEVVGGQEVGTLVGHLEVMPEAGGLGAVFLELAGAGSWIVALQPPASGPFTVRLRLCTGDHPPLVLASAPLRLESPGAAGSGSAASSRRPRWRSILEKLKPPAFSGWLRALPGWPWSVAALAGALLSAILLLARRRQKRFPDANLDALLDDDALPGKMKLLLRAKLEVLEKEKAALVKALETMQQERDRLGGTAAALEQEVQRQREGSREKSRNIAELEQNLAQAREEVKSMQQEYMALYARSGSGKETLRKN